MAVGRVQARMLGRLFGIIPFRWEVGVWDAASWGRTYGAKKRSKTWIVVIAGSPRNKEIDLVGEYPEPFVGALHLSHPLDSTSHAGLNINGWRLPLADLYCTGRRSCSDKSP